MTTFRFLRALLVCTLVLAGCARKTPSLRVYPSEGLPFAQRFPRVYLSQNQIGDYEVLMVSEGVETTKKQGKILYPVNTGSVRQIVHIRILWKPLPGTRTDQPTATNATINWYVRSNMPGEENSKIDYSGAGYVGLYPNKNGAHIVIRNANLALREQAGDMTDPFGKPSIVGSFDAVRNDGIIRDILGSLNAPVAMR